MAYSTTFLEKQTNNATFVKTVGSSSDTHLLSSTANWTNHKAGSSVPNYKDKIRDGLNAASPYSRTAYKFLERREGFLLATYKDLDGLPGTYIDSVRGNVCMLPESLDHDSDYDMPKAEATALSKVYDKLNSELSHLNSAAVAAEFMDVIRQFGSPFNSIVDLHNRYLNRLFLERRRLSGSTTFKEIKLTEIAANTWLEMSFGLAPLISDTKAVAEAISRWQNEEREEILRKLRSKISSRATSTKKTHTVDNPVTNLHNQIWSALTRTRTANYEARCQYTVGLQGSIGAAYGSNERLIEILGFKPEDFIPAAWEAAPWSWLADYFTNISEIIDAGVTSTARVSWIVKTKTKRCIAEERVRPNGKTTTNWFGIISQSTHPRYGLGTQKIAFTSMDRSIPASLGIPPLVFEHPFDDMKKMLNMASVLMARKSSASALWLW